MSRVAGFVLLIFVGIIAWRIGDALSSDAISMAVGVLFGVLAGIPTALLVLVGGRRPQPIQPTQPEPPAPTIIINSTTNNLIIPPAVQQGIIQRRGDQAIQTDDGHWLILRDQQVVGRMVPRNT